VSVPHTRHTYLSPDVEESFRISVDLLGVLPICPGPMPGKLHKFLHISRAGRRRAFSEQIEGLRVASINRSSELTKLQYFQDEPDRSHWLNALAEGRRLAAREG
jgi:hypothetical protein